MPSVEIPPSGSLETTSPLRLYYLAGSSDANGLLTLALADRSVQVHFRKGNPEFIDSSHGEDQLSTFLVKNQLASFEQLGKAEKEKARFGGELIAALFGLGLLNPATAFQQLGQRAAAILFRGLFAEHGTFTWEAKDLPAHKAMPLGQRWAVVSEQVRKLPLADLKRRLLDALNLPVMKSGGLVPIADLRLTPQETRALSYFDGVRSLNQLIHDLPNDAEHLLRVAFLLKEVDSVAFAAVQVAPPPTAAPKPAPVVAPPPAAARPPPPKVTATPMPAARPPPQAATPMPRAAQPQVLRPPPTSLTPPPIAVDALTEIKNLTALNEKMKTQNYFEILGLNPNADAAAVKVAYFKFARAYHPDTVPPDAPEQLGKLKAEIFGRVGDANRMLSDDKTRAEYLEEVKAGNAGEKVDIAQILAAEEMFQKGGILVKARKFPEAVKMLDDAIKANAEEGEYFAWRGYAKFFTFPDKKQGFAEAMKDIAVCLKRNDKVAAAWYFQGHMSKLLGDNAAAKKHFQKCVQLNPEHIDAQRELRLLK
jgi:curved DNA-binding protein CbpA